MRTDPILSTLSITDLNQRYTGSFFHYNKKVVQCSGFEHKEGRTRIRLMSRDGMYFEDFKPEKVNVYRPPARWMMHRDMTKEGGPEVPIFFSYRPVRQWSRGFSRDTCEVWCPLTGRLNITSAMLQKLFDEETPTLPKVPYKKLWEESKEKGWKILSPSLAVAKWNKELHMFFRSSVVAKLQASGLHVTAPHFEQEISESIIR